MSCICTGSLESENVALKEKLAAIVAAWKKLAPQLWVEEPDAAFTEALEAMHSAVRGEGEQQQSENEKLRAALGEAVKALVNCLVPLEVLHGQIMVKPYTELTADFQTDLCKTVAHGRNAFTHLRPLLAPNSAEVKTK